LFLRSPRYHQTRDPLYQAIRFHVVITNCNNRIILLDKDNTIGVGGRSKHAASISIFQRNNPIVLPAANSNFTRLLLCNEHVRLMRGGPQVILSSIRMNYWPINGRNLARNIVSKCVICFKQKPIIIQPIMGDLP